MPLDNDARRYADNLFTKSLDDMAKDHNRETAQIRADFAKRGMMQSGGYITTLVTANMNRVHLMAQARADSLTKAYERSGLAFDDAALQEISEEVSRFCNSQQHNAVLALGQSIQQVFGGQSALSEMEHALVGQIQRGIGSIIAQVTRDLRIRRDEVILDEKRSRKAYAAGLGKEWDVFVCHASEDKEDFVRPLVSALAESGLRVWYDERTLRIGDSLRVAIDEGLARSRFGIVVLSSSFFEKRWPQQELDGLVSKEVVGVKVILPIWHNISAEEVRRNSPLLAGRIAAKSSDGLATVVRQLREAMGL